MRIDFAEQVAGIKVRHDTHIGESIDIRLGQKVPPGNGFQQTNFVWPGEIVDELR